MSDVLIEEVSAAPPAPPRAPFAADDAGPLLAAALRRPAPRDAATLAARVHAAARRSPAAARALADHGSTTLILGHAAPPAGVVVGVARGTTPATLYGGRLDADALAVEPLLEHGLHVVLAVREDGTRAAVLLAADAPGVTRDGARLAIDGLDVPDGALVDWPETAALGAEALAHAAASLGIADALLADAAAHARDDARPWPGRTYASLIHDPHVMRGFGRASARLAAARAALDEAIEAYDNAPTAAVHGALAAQAGAAGALAELAAGLPDLLGPSAVDHQPLWVALAAARRHALRDSTAWRHYAVGQHVLDAAWADPDRPGDLPDVAPPGGTTRIITSAAEALAVARAYAAVAALEASDRDRNRAHARAELRLLARTGLLGITVPAAYGGLEASWATVAQVVRIVAASDGSISQILQPHYAAIETILTAGTEAQRRFFFRQALDGARFGSANGERGTKAAGDITTRLVPTLTGSYRVEGTKFYCTGSLSADWIAVTARDPAGNRSSALVHREAAGLELIDDWSGIGQRTTASGTTRLDGVEVAELHVLAQWRAAEGAHLSGAKANLVHAAVNVGIGFGALAAGRDYVLTRSRPSKDLGLESVLEDPHLVHRFGELHGRQQAALALLLQAGAAIDAAAADGASPAAISAATLAVAAAEAHGGDVALEVAQDVFALAGASASRAEIGLDRHWRDVRTHTLHDHAVWKYHQIGDALLSGAQYFGNRRNVI